jgi:hypothetical protein
MIDRAAARLGALALGAALVGLAGMPVAAQVPADEEFVGPPRSADDMAAGGRDLALAADAPEIDFSQPVAGL